ncbi:hypothetical protein UFOVP1382_207 [uncultured Caudovirales phage]|uniref:Uncharacterized protein n=1 Tax=uncultured Caudovirales phage TaxID=2100421 RepID=A0A6J5S5G9_9CAUD|nr:hypothetical protein UFOVP1382_207 [uncultured Caudovirales phage]
MADLSALKSKIRKTRALNPMSDFQDVIIEDMAGAVATLGLMDEAANGWRGVTITLIPGVDIDVAKPREPMVEMDGMTLFGMLTDGSKLGADKVVEKIGLPKAWDWAKTKIPEEVDGFEPKVIVLAAVMFEVMRAQGWSQVGIHWKSPIWLFPMYRVPYGAVLAQAAESLTPTPALAMGA